MIWAGWLRVTRNPLVASALFSLLLAPVAAAQDPSQPPPSGTGQTVAAAEDQAKPTRAFFPTLFHNLGDDVKHMPRKNSLYWLAAGSALALAVHPEDNRFNRRLRGSSVADSVFVAGKYVGAFPVLLGAGVGTLLAGKVNGSTRATHLGMDLIEATLLSEGITRGIKAAAARSAAFRQRRGVWSGGRHHRPTLRHVAWPQLLCVSDAPA